MKARSLAQIGLGRFEDLNTFLRGPQELHRDFQSTIGDWYINQYVYGGDNHLILYNSETGLRHRNSLIRPFAGAASAICQIMDQQRRPITS